MPRTSPANPFINEGSNYGGLTAGGRFDMGRGSWGPKYGVGPTGGYAGSAATGRTVSNGLMGNKTQPYYTRPTSSPDGRTYPQPDLNPLNHVPSSVKPPVRDLKVGPGIPGGRFSLPSSGTSPSSGSYYKPTGNAASLPRPGYPQGGLTRPNPKPSPNTPKPKQPSEPLPRKANPLEQSPEKPSPQPEKPTPPRTDRPNRPNDSPRILPPSEKKAPPQQRPDIPLKPYRKPPFRGGQGHGLYRVTTQMRVRYIAIDIVTGANLGGGENYSVGEQEVWGPIRGIVSEVGEAFVDFYLESTNPSTLFPVRTGQGSVPKPGTIVTGARLDYLDGPAVDIIRCLKINPATGQPVPDTFGDPVPLTGAPLIHPGAVPALPMHAPAMTPQPGTATPPFPFSPFPSPTPKHQPNPSLDPNPRTTPTPSSPPLPRPESPPYPQPQPSPDSPPVSPEARQPDIPYDPVTISPSPPIPTGNPTPGREPPPCPPYCGGGDVDVPCRYQPPKPVCDEPCIVQMKQEIEAIKNKINGDIDNKLDELLNEEEPDFLERLQEVFDLLEQLFNQQQSSIEEQLLRQVLDLLSQILYSLEPGQQGDSGYVPISVPIAEYAPDGTVSINQKTISVFFEDESRVRTLFEELVGLKEALSLVKRNSIRTHNVLGGTGWFTSESSLVPKLKIKPESLVKQTNIIPASSKESEPEQIASNLLDLLKAYTAVSYQRLGLQNLPASVPETLLGYTDKKDPVLIPTLAEYLAWFVRQFDAVAGKFPIEIEIEDADPLTAGNQTKKVELPNISEAIAELFGLAISGATNSDVAINFLMRLAAEVISAKNAIAVTQDYARANAEFLGYRGNVVNREINYAFNPSKLDSLEEFLKETKGYVAGWEEDDKESVVGYLQRMVFAAGIIKAVFFRSGDQVDELQKAIANMVKKGGVNDEAEWRKFIELLNNPNSKFNQGQHPQPKADSDPNP